MFIKYAQQIINIGLSAKSPQN